MTLSPLTWERRQYRQCSLEYRLVRPDSSDQPDHQCRACRPAATLRIAGRRRIGDRASAARSFSFRLADGNAGVGNLLIQVTADQNVSGMGTLVEVNAVERGEQQ